MIPETKKNKLNQMNKAHILGSTSYICCVLIYVKENDKNIDVYIPLFNLKGMIKKYQHLKEMKKGTYT